MTPVTASANISISGPGSSSININATETGGVHGHHHHHDWGGSQQSGNDPSSAQGKIDRGNQLVQQGMQTGNWQEVQQGQNLINQGTAQLAAQQSSQPPCQPSSSNSSGQSSNPLSMLTQALAPVEKMLGLGGGGSGGMSFLSMFGMGV
jgi:hypothetical protein